MTRTKLKRLFTAALLLCFIVVLLAGCTQGEISNKETEPASSSATKPSNKEEITLRVLVEEALGADLGPAAIDQLHNYLPRWKSSFRSSHKNVEIVIEKLPKGDGRAEMLQRLRAEMMVGEGPDILLLPTLPTFSIVWTAYVEPLIPDVQTAMHNGLFQDISAYYDADTELDKEGLNSTVMDAGLLDGARYVLPLCYDMPVACVVRDAVAQSGVSQDIFTYNAIDLMHTVAQMEDLSQTGSFYQFYDTGSPMYFNFFPQLIDYDTGEVAVTQETLAEYLRAWQACQAQTYRSKDVGGTRSISRELMFYYGDLSNIYWAEEGNFASCTSLRLAAENLLQARTLGMELDMYPMRAVDGSVVADVTLYGAVTSGCEHPEIAYEFIREFLGEKFQLQTERLTGLDFYGWPVRTKGSVVSMCKAALTFVGSEAVNSENITDSEMPILDAQIDHVRFSIPLETEFARTVKKLINQTTGKAFPTDIDQVAADWVKKLQTHADEG